MLKEDMPGSSFLREGGGEAAAIKIMGQKNYASFGSGSIYYIEMHN